MQNREIGVISHGLGIAAAPYSMTRPHSFFRCLLCICVLSIPAKAVWGQTPAAPAPAQTAAAADNDDAALVLAEPDFALINLPTTLRLPRFKGNFRLTHRFQGNLEDGDFGYQLSNLFGLDNGAAIGLEYRFAVMRHLQLAA